MCAAPNSAYLTQKLPLQIYGVVKYDNLLAYKLSEYGPNIKSLFYLDVLFIVKNGSTEGFIGAVQFGGTNAPMHADARIGKGRIKQSIGGQTYILLNDAGLNTSGIVSNLSTITQHDIENFIIPSFQTSSAYYVDGSFGVDLNINNSGWQRVEFNTQTRKTTINSAATNVGDLVDFKDSVKVRNYHSNAEKDYLGPEQTTTINAALINMKFDATWASWANDNPSGSDYYYSVRGILFSTIYLDPLGNTVADAGYYIYDGKWYKHEFSGVEGRNIVTDFGNAIPGQWPAGDPGNPPVYTIVNYDGFSSIDSTTACGLPNSPVALYRRNVDQIYFSDVNLTTLAPTGWYIEDSLTRGWFYILNGVMNNSGSC